MPKASDIVNQVFDIAIEGAKDLDAKLHEAGQAVDGAMHNAIAYLETLRAQALGLFQGTEGESEPTYSEVAQASVDATAEKIREVVSAYND